MAEVCDGKSTKCPADKFAPDGTPCGAGKCSLGACEAAGIDPALGAYIDKMYLSILKRAADLPGKTYWAGQYATVLPSCQLLTQALVGTPEAEKALFGFASDTTFLNNLYLALLWRPADAGGQAYWLSELSAGKMTRELLVQAIIQSPEFGSNCSAAGLSSSQ